MIKGLYAIKFFAAVVVIFFTAIHCYAYTSPIGLEILSNERDKFNLAFPGPKEDVAGIRLSIGAQNKNVYGLDVGVAMNETKDRFVGIAIAGFANVYYGRAFIIGLELAGFSNAGSHVSGFGLQVAGFLNSAGSGDFVGGQVAIFRNEYFGHIYGFQLGLFNDAKSIVGVQIGIINKADNLHGVQIGLLNYNKSGIPCLPLINIGF